MPDSDGLALERARWRLDALDAWRKDVEQRLHSIEGRVNELVANDELAHRLAAELTNRAERSFSRGQKIAGGLAAAIVALAALGSFILEAITVGSHP